MGASIQDLTAGKLKNAVEQRIISGNVLTGTRVVPEGHLGYYDNQITVIPEGNNYEFLGWAAPGFNKFSASRLFPSFLCPKKHYTLDTNYHGERRAFVVTGQYEKVFPMDIYPVYLLKLSSPRISTAWNNSVSTKLCPKTWLYVNLSVPRRRLFRKS